MDEPKTSRMFYSQCLLSKKGALSSIWVAGFCLKRLKKLQVTQTHIPSSVDKIIQEGLPSITYRILAYLLLGVVRIYSRKVEYLFEDCHHAVCDINKFKVGKEVIPFKDLVRRSHSIVLPNRYELDAFQVEFAEDAGGGHNAQDEDIVLQDARKDTFPQIQGKKTFGEGSSPNDESSECDVPPSAGINVQHEISSFAQTPNKVSSDEGTSMGASTPPVEVLSPHQVQIDKEISSPDHVKDHQTSKEKLRQLRFMQSEFMDVDTFCGVDIELLKLIDEYESQKTGAVDENDVQESVRNTHVHDHEHELVRMQEKEVPSPVEKTPKSEAEDDATGAHCCGNKKDDNTPEFLVIPTPAKKEVNPRLRKRKCTIDNTTVLDNKVIKQAINDASDLVHKRRKVTHSMIDIWMVSRFPTLPKNFSEPLIPCAAMEPQHICCVEATERMEASTSTTNKAIEITKAIESLEVASPRTPADSRSIIAPGTPVRGPTSARFIASSQAGDSEGEGPVHSYENTRKDFPVLENEDYSPNMMDEMGDNEGDSQEHFKNKSGMSARTRSVARYLHEVIYKKKRLGKDSVTLYPILQCKTRAETARFFYEILVLSSSGLVNVRQEKAYDDVYLQETTKMEATVMNS